MVQFVKQSDKVKYPNRCFSANLSNRYVDVFDNKRTTANIRHNPNTEGLFLEVPTAQTPDYGSGDVVGYKLGLYLNSINNLGNPQVSIWKARRGITKNEGTFGQEIVRDIHIVTALHTEMANHSFMENFNGITNPGAHALVTDRTVFHQSEPFIDFVDAYADAKFWTGVSMDRDTFEANYVTTVQDAGYGDRKVVFVHSVADAFEGNVVGEGSPSLGERGHSLWTGLSEMVTGGDNGYAIVTQSGSAPIYSGSGTKVGRTLTGADPNWPGSGA